MAITISQIEKIKSQFESGKSPKEIAKSLNESKYRIGSLARLLGYSFATAKRNPMDWHVVPKGTKNMIVFAIKSLHLDSEIGQYRVSEVNEKTKTITILYK